MSNLLDEVRNTLRVHHYAMKTVKSYVQLIERFILFHKKRHSIEMGNSLPTKRGLVHTPVRNKLRTLRDMRVNRGPHLLYAVYSDSDPADFASV